MTRNAAAAVHFAAAIAAASVAAFIVASSAFADEIAVDKILSTAAARTAMGSDRAHLHHISADVLKGEFLMCERAAAQSPLDLATAGACSMLYEELRERVFGGSFDALITWWGGAREAYAETGHINNAGR